MRTLLLCTLAWAAVLLVSTMVRPASAEDVCVPVWEQTTTTAATTATTATTAPTTTPTTTATTLAPTTTALAPTTTAAPSSVSTLAPVVVTPNGAGVLGNDASRNLGGGATAGLDESFLPRTGAELGLAGTVGAALIGIGLTASGAGSRGRRRRILLAAGAAAAVVVLAIGVFGVPGASAGECAPVPVVPEVGAAWMLPVVAAASLTAIVAFRARRPRRGSTERPS